MSKENNKYVAVGGQALMEGIMMKGPKGTAMSLRLPDGSIETQMKEFVSIRKKIKLFNIPIIRGIVSFVESMLFGYKLLMESAEKTALDTESAENESKLDKWIGEHFGPKMMAFIGGVSAVLGVVLAFFLFIYLPSLAFDLIKGEIAFEIFKFKPFDPVTLPWSSYWAGKEDIMFTLRAVIEGFIRVVVFVIYMYAVSKMKEIHRVYMYHGAEHKTIFAFEHGKELTVENIRNEKRCHPRCGTSFIFVTIILSIIISTIVAVTYRPITENTALWTVTKILMVPPIMGIGFEFIQLAGKYPNKFTKLLSAPGLLMQRITTAEPTDDIIEVAIAAMNAALTGEIPQVTEEASEEVTEETPEEKTEIEE